MPRINSLPAKVIAQIHQAFFYLRFLIPAVIVLSMAACVPPPPGTDVNWSSGDTIHNYGGSVGATGRPLGSGEFMDWLARRLGVDLAKKKPGPKVRN